MTHDDLVIWAWENAAELVKQAGFAPDGASRADRSELLAGYVASVNRGNDARLLSEWLEIAAVPLFMKSTLFDGTSDFLARLRLSAQSPTEWRAEQLNALHQNLSQEREARLAEWPHHCVLPEEICWPDDPADWFRVTDRVIEMPIKRDGGRRFIDLAVSIAILKLRITSQGEARIEADAKPKRFFFEIKPTIRRLDELLQQCRIYRDGHDCQGLAIVSPDTRYKTILEEQGFPFIAPGIGQQSLGF